MKCSIIKGIVWRHTMGLKNYKMKIVFRSNQKDWELIQTIDLCQNIQIGTLLNGVSTKLREQRNKNSNLTKTCK